MAESRSGDAHPHESESDDGGDEEYWESFLWGKQMASHLSYPVPAAAGNPRLRHPGALQVTQNHEGEGGEALGSAEGLHTVVWEAAVALHLTIQHETFARLHGVRWGEEVVVELGAGTGLVGMCAAALGARVVLTELSDALPILQHNIDDNFHTLTTAHVGHTHASPRAMELAWGGPVPIGVTRVLAEWSRAPTPTSTHVYPTMVLGADITYHPSLFRPLVDTLCEVCGPKTQCFLARLKRGDPAVMAGFYDMLGERFDVSDVPFEDAERFRELTDQGMGVEIVRAVKKEGL